MKSYNCLFDKLLTDENIDLAIRKAIKGKKKKRKVYRDIIADPPAYYDKVRSYIINYQSYAHKSRKIYDGITRKERFITVPSPYEQIMHHAIMNLITDKMLKGMYQHSYGSIPKRGSHKGSKVMKSWIEKYSDEFQYVLKLDIKKYFENVDVNILKQKLKRKIKDKKYLEFLYKTLDKRDLGIALGFYPSQWFANFYLTGLDHYIKQEYHARFYMRYMDDMVIIGKTKEEVWKIFYNIKTYLSNELHLEVKENYQVYKFDYIDENGKRRGRDIDFMGFRFFHDKTILRKSLMYKCTRKARRTSKMDKPTLYSCRQNICYGGWIKHTDTYNMYLKHIKPYADYGYMEDRVSRYDKRQAKIKKLIYKDWQNRQKNLCPFCAFYHNEYFKDLKTSISYCQFYVGMYSDVESHCNYLGICIRYKNSKDNSL